MPIQFRINSSRMGFVKDSSCNYALRTYFFKSQAFIDRDIQRQSLSLEERQGQSLPLADFNAFLCIMFIGLNFITDQSIDVEDIKRIQVFYNEADNYFSIVMGLKINSVAKSDIENSSLRYAIAAAAFYFQAFTIYTNAYETHLQTGNWDSNHCLEGPRIDIRLRDAGNCVESALRTQSHNCRICELALGVVTDRPDEPTPAARATRTTRATRRNNPNLTSPSAPNVNPIDTNDLANTEEGGSV